MGGTHFCPAPWYPVRGYSRLSHERTGDHRQASGDGRSSEKPVIRPLACHGDATIAELSVIGTSLSEIDLNLHQKCTSCGRGSHVGLPGEQAISSL